MKDERDGEIAMTTMKTTIEYLMARERKVSEPSNTNRTEAERREEDESK
jgi:hypothetical protein